MSCATGLDDGLAARWATYLARNFHSTQQVMAAFSVSRRTAEYWLAQAVEPRGRHLAAAMRRNPEAIPLLIGDDA